MSKKVLDLETKTTKDYIWIAGVLDTDTDVYTQYETATDLRCAIHEGDTIIMHGGIDFDHPVLKAVWDYDFPDNVTFIDTLVMSRLYWPRMEGGHSLGAWGKRLNYGKGDFTDYDGPGMVHDFWQTHQWIEDFDLDNDGSMQLEAKGHEIVLDPPIEHVKEECWVEWDERMAVYCEQDCRLTWKLYGYLMLKMRQWQVTKTAFDLEHDTQWVVSEQVRNGIHFNIPKAQALYAKLNVRLSEILAEMQEEFPPIVTERWSDKTGKRLKDGVENFNPNARQQIAKRLMARGVKFTEYTELSGDVQINGDILEALTHPAAASIQEYMMLGKRISQFDQWFEYVDVDTSRIHGQVNSMGAGTYRMSQFKPNLAQVPATGKPYGTECRELFDVAEGNVMLGCDASGLELRMFAHATGNLDYVQAVTVGDPHQFHADILGIERRIAKTFIYAFLYGAGNGKLGSILGGTMKDGAGARIEFTEKLVGLLDLKERVEKEAEKGYVTAIDGRRIRTKSAHSALNYRLQGDGALVMKRASVNCHGYIRDWNPAVKPMQVVAAHDEWQFEVVPGNAEHLGRLAVESIRQAGRDFNMVCPLDGEYMIGKSWAETH